MDTKTITIIIATYNAEKTLQNCLNSISSQKTKETELLIIDGKSTDHTIDIITSNKSIVDFYLSESDKGIYDAWNKGIQKATGKWIMFIGADDILLPGALIQYINLINNTPNIENYDYICANNEFIGESGKVLKIMGEAPSWNRMRRYMAAAHVASLHNKKNLFDKVGLYNLEYKICADYELLLRKKDKLNFLFKSMHIAQMKVGGMSFSTKAIIETYFIRKKHQSVSPILNILLFLRDWLGFKIFILKNIKKL